MKMLVPFRRRIVKVIFLITIIGFLITNLNLLIQSGDDNTTDNSMDSPLRLVPINQSRWHRILVANDTSTKIPLLNTERHVAALPHHASSVVSDEQHNKPEVIPVKLSNHSIDTLSFQEIQEHITRINSAQTILNLDTYDLRAGSDTVVVVIQVHNRAEYLRHLVDSFSNARNIDKVLLIFSHDFFSSEVEEIVHSITFCPVMQIFYPYPMQIHPNEFPGEDLNDCPRDIKRDQAIAKGCNNAYHPDKYGHYREAKFAQTKHHWFWKINHIFDHLHALRQHTGPVLFVEEDHYVSPDFIHVLLLMTRLQTEACAECRIMTLGTYDKNPTFGTITSRVDVSDWSSSKHNMGMSLTRDTWKSIRQCAKQFCTFDDYNWDWSLQHISMTCIPKRLKVMVMKSPRIFHIGDCGVHHKGKNCNPVERVHAIRELLKRNNEWLFPHSLQVNAVGRQVNRSPKPNGGWGDVRDHQLCLKFTEDLPDR